MQVSCVATVLHNNTGDNSGVQDVDMCRQCDRCNVKNFCHYNDSATQPMGLLTLGTHAQRELLYLGLCVC